jgi:hypothetical protein
MDGDAQTGRVSRGRKWVLLVLLFLLASASCPALASPGTVASPPAETPTPDRLAVPVMPEAPTQLDVGRNLYYYHCMPCHGDRGQGLTDEWRQAWVHDHQNCWARGCHSGRSGEEGFFIPRHVPPVSGSPGALGAFATADDLFVFLRDAHPPQRPGALSDSECWALTAFLLHENGRLSPGAQLGPAAAERPEGRGDALLIATLGLLTTMLLALWAAKQKITP